jgi:hypothetical protein
MTFAAAETAEKIIAKEKRDRSMSFFVYAALGLVSVLLVIASAAVLALSERDDALEKVACVVDLQVEWKAAVGDALANPDQDIPEGPAARQALSRANERMHNRATICNLGES